MWDKIFVLVVFIVFFIIYKIYDRGVLNEFDGWKISKNKKKLYKEIKGIPVSIQLELNKYHIYLYLPLLTKNEKEQLKSYVKKLDDLRIFYYQFDDSFFHIEIRKYTKQIETIGIVNTCIDYITDELKVENNICIYCQLEGANDTVIDYGIYSRAHQECIDHEIEKYTDRRKNQSCIKGIMGTSVYSAVFISIYSLLKLKEVKLIEHNFVETVIIFLMMIIMLVIYVISKGKLNRYTKYIMIAILAINISSMTTIDIFLEVGDIELNIKYFKSIGQSIVNKVELFLLMFVFINEKFKRTIEKVEEL